MPLAIACDTKSMRRSRASLLVLLSVPLSIAPASCTGDDDYDEPTDAGPKADATLPVDSSTGAPDGAFEASQDGAGDSGNVDRGPTVMPFSGDPSGLYWDNGVGAALYIADDKNNRIAKWTDSAGFGVAASLPDPPDGGGGLGQVVRLLDGTLLVTRFGFGFAGGILIVTPQGDAGLVTAADAGLDPTRRRIGLGILPDGTIIDTFFKSTDAGRVGAVAKVNLINAKETDYVTSLQKPVGAIYVEGKIDVTDQDLGLLLRVGYDGGPYQPEAGATLDAPDALCVGPDGSVFVGSVNGFVYQVSRGGAVTTLATGLEQVHGVAYDSAHKRLFVSEHDSAGAAHAIRIYPIP